MKLFLISLSILVLFSACGDNAVGNLDDANSDTKANLPYSKAKYGQWLYVDSDDSISLTSTGIKYNGYISSKNKISTLKESEENLFVVTTVGGETKYLMRDSSSSLKVVANVTNVSTASQSSSLHKSGLSNVGSIKVLLKNLDDSSLSKKDITVKSDGKIEVSNITSGEYEIVIEDGKGKSASTKISIEKDVQDLGIFTLKKKSLHNFKSEVILKDHSKYKQYIYGYEGLKYSGVIRVTNIGSVEATGLSYEFNATDEKLSSFVTENILGTVEAGKYKDIPFTISFKQLDKIQRDVKIKIKIQDVNNNVWNDYVTLRVYKRPIALNITTNTSSVKGYVVVSGHKLVPISTSNSKIYLPYIPSTTYSLLLANSDLVGETTYSVGLDTAVLSVDDLTKTGIYEPNNKESEATKIELNSAIVAYLHRGDLDIYTLSMANSTEDTNYITLKVDKSSPLYDKTYSYSKTNGNDDSILNKGETARFNLGIKNSGSSDANDVVTTISTTDQYIKVGNIDEPKYIIEGETTKDTEGRLSSDSNYLRRTYGDFNITAAADTPDNHTATIDVLMVDQYGNQWSDTFTVTVGKIGAQLKVDKSSPLYDETYSSYGTNGNDDSILNKGETARFNLGIKNSGSSDANDVVTTISTTDQYIKVGNIDEPKYIIEGETTKDTEGRLSSDSNYLRRTYGDFNITAAADTPDNHTATIDVLMVDQYGNQWSDTFTVTVGK